ncbi:MAG: hypothetical protein KGL65_02410 [Rhodospirillales bacterium]|nr:hypothetical protein [Rhodospirillales bacterium]
MENWYLVLLAWVALKKALYNYMHGIGIEQDVRDWFEFKVPKARVPRHKIARALQASY